MGALGESHCNKSSAEVGSSLCCVCALLSLEEEDKDRLGGGRGGGGGGLGVAGGEGVFLGMGASGKSHCEVPSGTAAAHRQWTAHMEGVAA